MCHAVILDISASLDIHFLEIVTVSCHVWQWVIMDVDASLGYEAFEFVATICQGVDPITSDQVTPAYIYVC